MKKIEIVMESSALEAVKECLLQTKVTGFSISNVMRYEEGKTQERNYRGACFQKVYHELTKLEAIVTEEQNQKIIECLSKYDTKDTLRIYELIVYDHVNKVILPLG